jgi:hypothetical protein
MRGGRTIESLGSDGRESRVESLPAAWLDSGASRAGLALRP